MSGKTKCISYESLQFLFYCENNDNIEIQHSYNRGEAKIFGYYVDGVGKKNGVMHVYEYNGNLL